MCLYVVNPVGNHVWHIGAIQVIFILLKKRFVLTKRTIEGKDCQKLKKKSLILCFCPEVILVLGDSIIFFWACNTKINSEVRLNAVRCPLSCYCYRKHSRKFHPKKKKKSNGRESLLEWRPPLININHISVRGNISWGKKQSGVCLVLLFMWVKQLFFLVLLTVKHKRRKLQWGNTAQCKGRFEVDWWCWF